MVLDLSQVKILVVDDNKLFRRFLKKLIEVNFKAEVVELENPQLMFDWLKNNEANLIILDMEMPYMDGYSALRLLRQEEKTSNVGVIVCTAISSSDLIARLVELRISDFIVKNSDTGNIIKKLVSYFKKNPDLIKN